MRRKQGDEFPVVELRRIDEPLQDYYSDVDGNQYSVARIVDEAKGLKSFSVPIAALDLSGVIWHGNNMKMLAAHVKAVNEADLKYPIILDWCGVVADGRHRIIKALIEGRATIKAVRLPFRMEPCKKAKGGEA